MGASRRLDVDGVQYSVQCSRRAYQPFFFEHDVFGMPRFEAGRDLHPHPRPHGPAALGQERGEMKIGQARSKEQLCR